MGMRLLLFIFLTLPVIMNAQDLEKHQWKNRIIVISSPSFENKEAAIQKQYLQSQVKGLKDRKLKVYHITNEGFTVDFNADVIVSKKSDNEITGFNVSLIGLDGSTKYQFTLPQSFDTFFMLIDEMPMRKAEVKHR